MFLISLTLLDGNFTHKSTGISTKNTFNRSKKTSRQSFIYGVEFYTCEWESGSYR